MYSQIHHYKFISQRTGWGSPFASMMYQVLHFSVVPSTNTLLYFLCIMYSNHDLLLDFLHSIKPTLMVFISLSCINMPYPTIFLFFLIGLVISKIFDLWPSLKIIIWYFFNPWDFHHPPVGLHFKGFQSSCISNGDDPSAASIWCQHQHICFDKVLSSQDSLYWRRLFQ